MQRLRLSGLIVLAIGIGSLIGGSFLGALPRNVAVHANSASGLGDDMSLTSYAATVRWADQPPSTDVYLTDGFTTCGSTPPGVAGNGSGPSGSFSASLDPGKTYWLFACRGGYEVALNATVSYTGGIGLPVVGFGLVILTGAILTARSFLFLPNRPPLGQAPAPEAPTK